MQGSLNPIRGARSHRREALSVSPSGDFLVIAKGAFAIPAGAPLS